MHHDRTADGPDEDRRPPSEEAERLLLLELVVDPPEAGDPLTRLVSRLRLGHAELDRAADGLVAVGLAVRDGDLVRASPAARRFDELWPISI